MTYEVHHGDVLATLRTMPDNSADALLSDPPYGLRFMGRKWDYDVPSVDVWAEALRVLKPGAPLLSFGAPRIVHRLVVAIEDAGFEVRDQIMWVFGSGFPKSLDVSKALDKEAGHWRGKRGAVKSSNGSMSAPNFERTPKGSPVTDAAATWQGYGTALKPAYEPIVLARKPLDGTVAENVTAWDVGALAIDACRVAYAGEEDMAAAAAAAAAQRACGDQNANRTSFGSFNDGPGSLVPYLEKQHLGRWPANVIFDEEAGAKLGEPARFYYCPKVSSRERNAGLEHMPARRTTYADGTGLRANGDGTARNQDATARNHHPTLKPLDLTRYLARLILPPTPAPRLLVPYSGTGSEMIGAMMAGWAHVIGIEGDAEYVEIAHARIAHWSAAAP